jgi:hypothetical protein
MINCLSDLNNAGFKYDLDKCRIKGFGQQLFWALLFNHLPWFSNPGKINKILIFPPLFFNPKMPL